MEIQKDFAFGYSHRNYDNSFFLVFIPGISPTEAAGGASIGIFLMMVSVVTKGQIGIGDGIICCFTGAACGFSENISILFIGLLLSAITATFLLIGKKSRKKTEIPFVPFLFLSYCCMQLLEKIVFHS